MAFRVVFYLFADLKNVIFVKINCKKYQVYNCAKALCFSSLIDMKMKTSKISGFRVCLFLTSMNFFIH